MIRLPQETTVMRGQPMDKIMSGLLKALTIKRLLPVEGTNGKVLAMIDDRDDSVIPFSVPVLMKDVNGNTVVCIDLRMGTKEYTETHEGIKVNGFSNAELVVNIATTMLAWNQETRNFLLLYPESCRVYANLISAKLGKVLTLDPSDTLKLSVYFAYFYYTRLAEAKVLPRQDYEAIVITRISRILSLSAKDVFAVLDKFNCEVFSDLTALCQAIVKHDLNPKLKVLNGVYVTTVMLGSWAFSPNSRELMGIAMEYPPMFITLLARALSIRSYKNTGIAQVGLRLLPGNEQKNYISVYNDITYRTLNR